jgi:hypothetical protein
VGVESPSAPPGEQAKLGEWLRLPIAFVAANDKTATSSRKVTDARSAERAFGGTHLLGIFDLFFFVVLVTAYFKFPAQRVETLAAVIATVAHFLSWSAINQYLLSAKSIHNRTQRALRAWNLALLVAIAVGVLAYLLLLPPSPSTFSGSSS